jgi:small subunit ribosomal protein SAe
MTRYVWKRNDDGAHIIDLRKTWEKLQLAARVIVAMNNPYDVCAVALTTGQTKQQPLAQRAVLKFSQLTGSRHIAGRYTPGTFTNRIQSNFCEPRLLVASDPIKDFQPILESSYVNMPVIAMADMDCPTRHIDIIIPCNTKSKYSVALIWWMLAREVLRLKGEIPRISEWDIPVDMFLYREPEEQEKLEQRSTYSDQYASNIWEGATEEVEFKDQTEEPVDEPEWVDDQNLPDTVGEPGGPPTGWGSDHEEVGWGLGENEAENENQWS